MAGAAAACIYQCKLIFEGCVFELFPTTSLPHNNHRLIRVADDKRCNDAWYPAEKRENGNKNDTTASLVKDGKRRKK